MADPARLKDTNDALAHALRAEHAEAARLPVAELGDHIRAAVAAGVAPVTVASSLSGGALALVVVATFVLGAAAGAAGLHAWHQRQRTTPVMSAAAPPASPPAPAPTVAQAPIAAPAPAAPTAVPATPPAVAHTSAPAALDAPATNALAAELQLFERGQGALEAGRPAIAVRELRAYLEQHPQGRLRSEATVGLVAALLQAGRPEEALDVIAAAPAHDAAALAAPKLTALTSLRHCSEAAPLAAALAHDRNDAARSAVADHRARCAP